MSNTEQPGEFDMSIRRGESVTDVPDWDNEVIEWDSASGIYYVAGKPVSMCQGVAMFKKEEDNDDTIQSN